eukprot:CAMPEP_0117505156 /NCGR_PEP_ID=MMETSP0784-20121206/25230_1 /TAXON_ID=39447 /ORGANISM="" /LENGTH=110 /DNA_ID=CAMNT_0005300555 /DNA_START=277 /DNA_END=609 /DNA_ORIENTATION=+
MPTFGGFFKYSSAAVFLAGASAVSSGSALAPSAVGTVSPAGTDSAEADTAEAEAAGVHAGEADAASSSLSTLAALVLAAGDGEAVLAAVAAFLEGMQIATPDSNFAAKVW